ncbi:DNA-binding domain-containing protein [Thiohalorhabdus sp. Cl-TMA]|uniref:DUF2063 domain-containing protein n=1 Tax=Thiohalorhabdus methylotrophus TaxID=3242694 RepID=A0ABV4TWM4_9GAMM
MSGRDSREPEPPATLRAQQEALAAYLRNPAEAPPPEDLDDRGRRVYRRLVFNNLKGLLSSNFPVLRRSLGEEVWLDLVADFLAEHHAETPYFLRVGEEFLAYLAGARGDRSGDPPFLLELAHYEWVELALSVAEEEPGEVSADPEGDLLTGLPVRSPLAWTLQYRFPVHRIGPGFLPEEPPEQPTCLVVYRDRVDAMGFLEINPVTARLLELITEDPAPGAELLRRVAGEIGHHDPERVVAAGADILADLRDRDVLLGTAPPAGPQTGS